MTAANSNTGTSLMKLKGAIRAVISDTNARNLMGFLILNFAFAFVEFAYGIWTNSLGLISDSFHMFFDCTGLIAGLAAQVVSRWPADDSYTYGYKRAEVLAGFVNALFLLFIAFFILTEAVERAIEPPEVHHERLFLVSVLGLFVNLVGIYVFQHGGAHGHTHCDTGVHGHSHSGNESGHDDGHNVIEDSFYQQHNQQVSILIGGGGQKHNDVFPAPHKGSAQSNHLMKGVLLHILADTLGSVGVVISALLMRFFGWMRADPICSIFIAILVAASVWGLLRDSARILMMRTPVELDDERRVLDTCYARLHRYHPAVMGIQEPRFWTLCADSFAGSIKIELRSTLVISKGTADFSPQSSVQFNQMIQANQQDHTARILHERDVFANCLIRYAQQIFGAVGVRQLYVEIYYTTDDTVTGRLLNHDSHHHNMNTTQQKYNRTDMGSLINQQHLQTYNANK